MIARHAEAERNQDDGRTHAGAARQPAIKDAAREQRLLAVLEHKKTGTARSRPCHERNLKPNQSFLVSASFFSPPLAPGRISACIFSYLAYWSAVRISFSFLFSCSMIPCIFSRRSSRGTLLSLKISWRFLADASSAAFTFGFCSSVSLSSSVNRSIRCSTDGPRPLAPPGFWSWATAMLLQ